MVNYVDHEIDLIKKSWTTKLDTKWESYGDGTGGDDTTNPLAEVCSEDTLRLREIDELRRYRVQLRLNRQIFEETYTEERLATVFTYRANESELLRTAAEIEVLQEQLTPEESEES